MRHRRLPRTAGVRERIARVRLGRGRLESLVADFKALALAHDLRACWSTPILTAGGKVLGTFAMYHKEPREPTVRDLALVDLVTQTAALVIDRERAHEALGRIAAMAG